MKKLIVVLLILIMIGGLAGGAYIFFITDIFKTPDQLFKKYLLNSFIELSNVQYEPYGELVTKMLNEPMKLNYISSDSAGDNIIEFDYLSNPISNNSKFDLSMTVNDEKYLTGSIIIAKEIFGIQIKDIHDKYLALENRDLKIFAENLGTGNEISQKIPNSINFFENFTEEEKSKLTEIAVKYLSKINDVITKESYIVEKQIAVNVNNQNLISDKYSLIVDEKEFYTLVLNTLIEFLSDQEFLEICEGRVDSEYINKLKEIINDLLIELEKQTNIGQIKFIIYVADKATKKCEIISKNGTTEWFLENTETESTFNIKTVAKKTSSNKVASESILKINNKYENNEGILTIQKKTTYNQKDVKNLENDISNLFSSNDTYKDSETKTIISSKYDGNTVTGEVVLEGFGSEENLKMTNNFKIDFNSEVEIEELNTENSIILNDYTENDFSNLGTELLANTLETAIEKPNSLIGSLSMILQFFIPQTDNEEDIINNEWEELTLDSNGIEIIEEYDESENIYNSVLEGINQSLIEYKNQKAVDENTDISDYLTVENIQEECPENYKLELIDGTTIKCIIEEQEHYYVTMNINGETLLVDEINVYTEEEYMNL